MRNSTISATELEVKIRKAILGFSKKIRKDHLSHESCLGSDLAPDSKLPIGVKLSSQKFKNLLGYLIIYHFYPLEPSILCYLHLDLQEHIEKNAQSFWLYVLLKDSYLFLKWLEEQVVITEQQLFAGIVNEEKIVSLLNSIKFSFEEKLKSPRRLVRRKGYRDKGSLGSESSRILKKELQDDFYLTLYQFELEEKERLRQAKALLLMEHLTEGRVLTDELLFEFKLISRKEVNNEQSRFRQVTAEDYCKSRDSEEADRKRRKTKKATT